MTTGQQIVDYLMGFQGTPYQWGGNNLSTGVDCSGLLQQGFAHFGIDIPRTTYDQIGQGKSVGIDQLQVGDAVFFDPNSQGQPDHVGIYIGNGKMLQAPHTGDVVKVTDMTTSYWTSRFVGGRRFDGIEGGGPANNDTSTQTTQDKRLSPQDLAASYGWAYSFLTSDPSLKGIFSDAVDQNWTTAKFQAELRNTDFWKNNSDTARKALQEKETDPATWSAKMQANQTVIQDLANKVGAAIPAGQLPKLAEQMEMFGQGEEQLRQILGGYIDFNKNGTLGGEAGMYEHTMHQYADSMGVDMNQQSIKNFAQLMVKGVSTPQDFQNFINQQAASAYPAFAQQIQAGQTMKNIANPYIQSMAQSFEIDPNTISLNDPTIKAGLNGVDENGKPTGKNLVDFQDSLRGDPRWASTQQAQDKTMQIGNQVLKSMGLTG